MKPWSLEKADRHFSKFIIERDGKCLRCGATLWLTCSHYHRRGHSATRFSPDNCIALCIECHRKWENLKDKDYKTFMVRRLGQERFDSLGQLARTIKNRTDAILECMQLLAK